MTLTRSAGTTLAAGALMLLAGCSASDAEDRAGADPSPTPTSNETEDERSWTPYRSDRYDLALGYPSDWDVVPASRDWRPGTDGSNPRSPGHEAFSSPGSDVGVSVWSTPLAGRDEIHSSADLVAWAEDYCVVAGSAPCTGIEDRAIDLCIEARDCHPGLLVPFEEDVQAFLSGGMYDPDAMTVVAVWRGDTDPHTAQYGGSQQLLEDFLSTMEVWPASTPLGERRVHPVP